MEFQLTILVLAGLANLVSTTECPSGYTLVGSFCYQYFHEPANFEQSENNCKKFGGFLAEPRNKLQSGALQTFQGKRAERIIWIGVTDRVTEGQFRWLSDNQALTYQSWRENEPNDQNGIEDCTVSNWGAPGIWNDRSCVHIHTYVCQTQPIAAESDDGKTVTININNGWGSPRSSDSKGLEIFFSAASSTLLRGLQNGTKIVYDTVWANEGNAYNANTGDFVAPVAGFFQFQISGLSTYARRFHANLRHNDADIVSIYGAAGHHGGSNTAILKLEKWDTVNVQVWSNNSTLHWHPAQVYNTFTGILLKQL